MATFSLFDFKELGARIVKLSEEADEFELALLQTESTLRPMRARAAQVLADACLEAAGDGKRSAEPLFVAAAPWLRRRGERLSALVADKSWSPRGRSLSLASEHHLTVASRTARSLNS